VGDGEATSITLEPSDEAASTSASLLESHNLPVGMDSALWRNDFGHCDYRLKMVMHLLADARRTDTNCRQSNMTIPRSSNEIVGRRRHSPARGDIKTILRRLGLAVTSEHEGDPGSYAHRAPRYSEAPIGVVGCQWQAPAMEGDGRPV
jgi:hypothetical protein